MANKIYGILGPMASGKATMISQLVSMGINYIPTDTTKIFNKREASRNMLYRTIKKEDFAAKDYMSRVTYQGEYYGLKKEEVMTALQKRKISVVVLQPDAVKQLMKFIKKNLVTIYLMADDVAMVDRMLRMGLMNEEIKYHMEFAESSGEFDGWKLADYVVKNTGDPHVAMEQILAVMGLVTLLPQEDFQAMIK